MQPQTVEWIEKAEGDWHAALSLYRVRKHPSYDAVCYHTQQAAEKYLKARLEEAGSAIPKIHDLTSLLQVVVTIEPNWIALSTPLASLNPFSVAYRYPGRTATKADAKLAIADCREVRRIIRFAFNLSV